MCPESIFFEIRVNIAEDDWPWMVRGVLKLTKNFRSERGGGEDREGEKEGWRERNLVLHWPYIAENVATKANARENRLPEGLRKAND